jgi:NADH:ubiquinone oxidoreductase subunit K
MSNPKEVTQNMSDSKSTGENIPIKRSRVDSLTVYEITDYELSELEKGSPSAINLNFSILLITLGISFLISLLTTEITSNRVFYVFVIIVSVSFAVGIILFIIWFKGKKSVKTTIMKIKERIPN